MPLYSVGPCPKCKSDRWRLIEIDTPAGRLLFSCLYCGTEKRVQEPAK
jgi:hypothetical protein